MKQKAYNVKTFLSQSPPPMLHFPHRGCTNGGPSVQTPETVGDISNSNHPNGHLCSLLGGGGTTYCLLFSLNFIFITIVDGPLWHPTKCFLSTPFPVTCFPIFSHSPTCTSPLNSMREAQFPVGKQTTLPHACSHASTSCHSRQALRC